MRGENRIHCAGLVAWFAAGEARAQISEAGHI